MRAKAYCAHPSIHDHWALRTREEKDGKKPGERRKKEKKKDPERERKRPREREREARLEWRKRAKSGNWSEKDNERRWR
ncbi:hypothetical protein TNCV_1025761 [Trichonephila clavipes]|nr:hypothetical protein TNCV_1025761 [Trichonephila clavipes]